MDYLSHKQLRRLSFSLFPESPPSVASMLIITLRALESSTMLPGQKDSALMKGILAELKGHMELSPFLDQQIIVNTIHNTGTSDFMIQDLMKELIRHKDNISAKIISNGNLLWKINRYTDMKARTAESRFFTILNNQAFSNPAAFQMEANPYEEKLISMLLKTTKQSTLLIGPAGIGKTSLVKRLVQRINNGDVPDKLASTLILQLDPKELLSKTKYRGEFEANVQEMFAEYATLEKQEKGTKPIIYTEELYTVIGAGSCEGQESLNLSSMLKPWLSNGDIIMIGDTTIPEFNKYIAPDTAFRRRFNELYMEPPDKKATIEILKHKAKLLKKENKIRIPVDLLENAVNLTDRFMIHRNQPDKSIDLLDGAVSLARRKIARTLEKQHLLESLENLTGKKIILNPGPDEIREYSRIASRLKKKILGQEQIIDRVMNRVLIRTTFNWSPSNRCLCGFLFSGPTGIGKTQLAKEMAAELNMKLLHLDMSEHSSLNKLLGAPPGYQGTGRGVLTEFLTTYQRGIILFDEVEKVNNPQIIHLFLQMLDEGRISSNDGQTFSLASIIIILATNAVTNQQHLGYNSGNQSKPLDLFRNIRIFPKEMLNRLDEILVFNPLDQSDMVDIFFKDLEIFKKELLENCQIGINYSRKGYLERYITEKIKACMNARDIPKLINGLILNRVIRKMSRENVSNITLDASFFDGLTDAWQDGLPDFDQN